MEVFDGGLGEGALRQVGLLQTTESGDRCVDRLALGYDLKRPPSNKSNDASNFSPKMRWLFVFMKVVFGQDCCLNPNSRFAFVILIKIDMHLSHSCKPDSHS